MTLLPRLLGCLPLVFGTAGLPAAGDELQANEKTGSAVVTINIDPTQRFQTIRGFGASGAWWPNYVADFPDDKRDQLLRLLFTKEGADLSIYRYNLPAGDGPDVTDRLRRTALVETAPGKYDFEADWKAQRILKEVRALGVERFVLFSKSPPPRMLTNGKVSGGPDGGSNLRPEARDDFARYLLDLTDHLKQHYDLPQVILSPINEPQWNWGRDRRHQEGCHYTPAELAATVRALVDAARERKLDIEIQSPESGEWKGSYAYARAMFDDPAIAETIRTFAVHSYWSTPQDREKFANWFYERYPDKALAMTEYCQMERGHGTGIEEALHMADVMHRDLVVANVESWQWWLCIYAGNYNDALIYAHPRSQKIEPTKRLWTMGNFSRFIRPGAIRVAAQAEGKLQISAYLSEAEDQLALVVINSGGPTAIRPSLPNPTESLQAFVTSEYHDLAPLAVANPERIDLPARSITTVVIPIDQAPEL